MRLWNLSRYALALGVATAAIMIDPRNLEVSSVHAASASCMPGILKQRLAEIRQRFGPVRIVSTFRRGARVRGSGRPSLHASCRAVDFHPPAGKYRQVANWLKANHGGGVGTYSCKMRHIHIDSGPRVRFHHCIR